MEVASKFQEIGRLLQQPGCVPSLEKVAAPAVEGACGPGPQAPQAAGQGAGAGACGGSSPRSLPRPPLPPRLFPCVSERATRNFHLTASAYGCAPGSNATIVYFQCDDCSVEEGRVTSSGGHVQRSKMAIGEYGYISLVFDTEGNMIGLHSMQ